MNTNTVLRFAIVLLLIRAISTSISLKKTPENPYYLLDCTLSCGQSYQIVDAIELYQCRMECGDIKFKDLNTGSLCSLGCPDSKNANNDANADDGSMSSTSSVGVDETIYSKVLNDTREGIIQQTLTRARLTPGQSPLNTVEIRDNNTLSNFTFTNTFNHNAQ